MTDYTKLIHDYLAGELSSEDEARLFEGLSRNPEWREEMQLQLQMERAMEKDLRSIAVPTHAANAVFAGLGFRRPSKWSYFVRTPRLATWTARRIALTGISGAILFAAGYVTFRSNSHSTLKPVAKVNGARNLPAPVNSGMVFDRAKAPIASNAQVESSDTRHLPIENAKPNESASSKELPAAVSKTNNSAKAPSFGLDEPLRYYSDIGNLYSVYYFTPQTMIGVSYAGQIFLSEDSGHTWALERSGVSCDLFGIHFSDMLHGLAVGAKGTILITADGGKSWNGVASGTKTTLSTVRFISQDTAYICGDRGTMLRSTDGGAKWEPLSTGVHANLFRMAFKNGMEGDVYSNDLHIATTDGGETWNIIR